MIDQKMESYFQDWKRREQAAEAMVPIVGRLYRDRGVIVTVKEWLDKRGKVKKVEVTTFVPTGSGGSGSAGGSGISQALSASNVVTGYQQTRNSGKLGRVSWHELLAP